MNGTLAQFRHAGGVTVVALLAAVVALIPVCSAQAAGVANFPGPPPAVQITRNLSLQQAAQAGVVKLTAKGGFEGDDVELELDGKQVKAPITVTLHLEFTMEPERSPKERAIVREALPSLEEKTERELNRPHYKTRKGEPINFDLDYKFREPGQPPNPEYDQVRVISPTKDLAEPDPEFRSYVEGLGVPNTSQTVGGVFSTHDLVPSVLAHESLHFIGLDDRYTDVYQYKGREIPLPEKGLSPKDLADFLHSLKPPIPPPPAGEVNAKDTPGTGRCDIMGSGDGLSCRKISKRDLKWLESQAGVQVEAKPGELLLNKQALDQNLAVGYTTRVIAPRGGTTIAPGVSGYCVDHTKLIPAESGFDVGPAVSALPGFTGVEKLLNLNAELQPNLTEPVDGFQIALWNVTDGASLEEDFAEPAAIAAARSILARAGVAENSTPGGVPHLSDPNAAAATTGAVDTSGAVLPAIASEALPPPPSLQLNTAELLPDKVAAGHKAHTYLVVGVTGEVSKVALRLQLRAGHHWRTVKKLPGHKLGSGNTVIPLSLGSLAAGEYRVRVSASGPAGEAVVGEAPLSVGSGG